jgi:hypothetical protein
MLFRARRDRTPNMNDVVDRLGSVAVEAPSTPNPTPEEVGPSRGWMGSHPSRSARHPPCQPVHYSISIRTIRNLMSRSESHSAKNQNSVQSQPGTVAFSCSSNPYHSQPGKSSKASSTRRIENPPGSCNRLSRPARRPRRRNSRTRSRCFLVTSRPSPASTSPRRTKRLANASGIASQPSIANLIPDGPDSTLSFAATSTNPSIHSRSRLPASAKSLKVLRSWGLKVAESFGIQSRRNRFRVNRSS